MKDPVNTRLLKLAASGVASSFIPWGKKDAFHGTGFPVFTAAWDRSKETGPLQDYPNPLGYILNPLLFVVVGMLIYWATRWCWEPPEQMHILNSTPCDTFGITCPHALRKNQATSVELDTNPYNFKNSGPTGG